jgi:hypothetical protein
MELQHQSISDAQAFDIARKTSGSSNNGFVLIWHLLLELAQELDCGVKLL